MTSKKKAGEKKERQEKKASLLVYIPSNLQLLPAFIGPGAYAIRMYLLVAVLEIITASAPDPIAVQIPGPATPGTAARRQLTVPAGTADGVDHSGGGDRVNERGFPARCNGQRRLD